MSMYKFIGGPLDGTFDDPGTGRAHGPGDVITFKHHFRRQRCRYEVQGDVMKYLGPGRAHWLRRLGHALKRLVLVALELVWWVIRLCPVETIRFPSGRTMPVTRWREAKSIIMRHRSLYAASTGDYLHLEDYITEIKDGR